MQKTLQVELPQGNTLPLVALGPAEKALPVTEEKVNAGRIIPVATVLLDANMLILALGATAFITLVFVFMFSWLNLIKAYLFVFLLPLFLLWSLRSVDRLRRSVNDLIWSGHQGIYIDSLRLPGRTVAAKDTWKAFAAISVLFACLSCLWFYTACVGLADSFTASVVLGCVSIAGGAFTLAVAMDLKEANAG